METTGFLQNLHKKPQAPLLLEVKPISMATMSSFGTRFELLLDQLDLTQVELANQVGCSDQTLSDWKRVGSPGRNSFGAVLKRLAEVAGKKGFPWQERHISEFLKLGTDLPKANKQKNIIRGQNPRNWNDSSPRIRISTKAKGGPAVDYANEMYTDRTLPHSIFPFYDREVDAAVINGNSMSPVIEEGDVVVFDRGTDLKPEVGDIVAVELAQGDGIIAKYFSGETEEEYIFESKHSDAGPALRFKKGMVAGIFPIMNIIHVLWTRHLPRWPFVKSGK